MPAEYGTYGLLAEFATPQALRHAAARAWEHGYRRLDAYSPFEVEGVSDVLHHSSRTMSLVLLFGGMCGALAGYFMQWFAAVKSFPINVGGRPLHSWPSFLAITFEMTVLFSTLSGLAAMIIANGVPCLYHPLFNVAAFDRATKDRFFLCIESRDPIYERDTTEQFLRQLEPLQVHEVPS